MDKRRYNLLRETTPFSKRCCLNLTSMTSRKSHARGYPVMCQKICEMESFLMNTTTTLSRLFAGIQGDLDLVDITFQERATSGLDILNSASMHVLGSPGKRLRTAITLLSGKLN